MPIGLELVHEPYDARVAEPQAPGEPVDRAPGREGGQRGDRAARPPGPEAAAVVAASTSRASVSTTAPSTFAVCCAPRSMPGAYITRVACLGMEPAVPTPAVAADAAAVTEVVMALESWLYGQTSFSQADLEDEWSDLDLEHNARVVRDGDRVVGYGAVHELGDLWRAEGFVHPDAFGRGVGKLIATALEERAAGCGARRIQNNVFEIDSAARALLESLGYSAVRVFREMRIELEAPPPAPEWPDGLRVDSFDPERDGPAFHAAQQEAFADHWDHRPRIWCRGRDPPGRERFDPTLRCVARAGDENAAGTISTADTYGGGRIEALFTRRARRKQGVGAALLRDALGASGSARASVGLGSTRRTTPALPPLPARRDDARARLGDVREAARRWRMRRARRRPSRRARSADVRTSRSSCRSHARSPTPCARARPLRDALGHRLLSMRAP